MYQFLTLNPFVLNINRGSSSSDCILVDKMPYEIIGDMTKFERFLELMLEVFKKYLCVFVSHWCTSLFRDVNINQQKLHLK